MSTTLGDPSLALLTLLLYHIRSDLSTPFVIFFGASCRPRPSTPWAVLVHTCIPRNRTPRGTGDFIGKVLHDSRGSRAYPFCLASLPTLLV